MNTYILLISGITFLLILMVIIRALISGTGIIGRLPVNAYIFVLAKICFVVNLVFLVIKGMDIPVSAIKLPEVFNYAGLFLLSVGFLIVFFSVLKLGRNLIFGFSRSESHSLQTGGIYKFSRHPFYLGFLLMLLSSCLFVSNGFNIAAFIITWIIHHQIMKKEEEYLAGKYGNEYLKYMEHVNRYITI